MSNLNDSNHETNVEKTSHQKRPIGNKFSQLVDGHPLLPIDCIVAESFIEKAKNGMLPFLNKNFVNYNSNGVYQVNCNLLREICEVMEENNAVKLNFTLVEIDSNHPKLDVNPRITGGMIYMVASLQSNNEQTIAENNYLIMNAKSDQTLDDLKISDQVFSEYKNLYDNGYDLKLKQYFSSPSGENTNSVVYDIADLKDTLGKVTSSKFDVHMCEVSDVLAIIEENNLGDQLNVALYEEHFASRVRQLTLVFDSGTDFYDMGSLRP
ncbi:hypothetical protein [Chryseobacterium luquanense]|uniref:Uncharacterized protein n=1 Tax=Chryseobacterium luquanense TaxID=2983766 RepID=A0ABT3Y1Z2_9FLAO|nr:hypothetical protein [Chryseobacterium luquanense]MCX8532096.1 hypothetical protein [Chryseobacterium luquanense]